MGTPGVFYSHSGRFSSLGAFAMLAAALLVGPILGTVYGTVMTFNPFIYINFLLTFFAAAWTGILVGKLSKPGRIRNLGLCAAAGLVAGLAFEYAQWCTTLHLHGAEATWRDPGALWHSIGELAEMEPWTWMGISIGATGFTIVWSLEAAIVVGVPALMAMGEGSDPYCERCENWTVDAEPLGPFDFVSDTGTLQARVERGDLDDLKAFERLEVTRDRYSTITLSSCTGCRGLQLARVQNVVVETGKDGKRDEEETDILVDVLLSAADHDALSKL